MEKRPLKKSTLRFFGLEELANHGWNSILAFWMIMGMAFFLFADQNLIAPNLKNIGASFGLNNQKDVDWYIGGIIPILFFILGGAVSVSMGYLSQKYSRKTLILFSVFLGEIPCFLSGFATSYSEFVIYRTLTGFGLGGIFPLLFTVLGDYFSDKSRSTAAAYVSLSMGIGLGVGQLLGGVLGNADPINGWRMSFIYLSIPSFFFAVIYWIFCKEPIRGGGESEWYGIAEKFPEESFHLRWSDVRLLFRNKTNIGIFLQGIPGCVPWGVFFVFLVDYYETSYHLDKTTATMLLTYAAIGVFAGTFLGGVIGQKIYNYNKRYLPIFCMSSILIGVPPCIYLLKAENIANSGLFIVINIVTGFIISVTGPNVRATLMNVNIPKNRSSMFALYNLTDDLGKGLGPAMSAVILGLTPGDRSLGLSISVLFWIPCAFFWLIVLKNFEKDEKNVHDYLASEAEKIKGAT
ncbi:MFS transporter [Leptospira alexanderi]|uniref:MFS transporter n=1 Tax=Leptospira alexanderi TaxID=100053 RepID=UPI000990A560|nr:MFS transporter [Leptospira alexanderi]